MVFRVYKLFFVRRKAETNFGGPTSRSPRPIFDRSIPVQRQYFANRSQIFANGFLEFVKRSKRSIRGRASRKNAVRSRFFGHIDPVQRTRTEPNREPSKPFRPKNEKKKPRGRARSGSDGRGEGGHPVRPRPPGTAESAAAVTPLSRAVRPNLFRCGTIAAAAPSADC